MLSFGTEPILECSSKGDKRFSAFYARIKSRGNKSIEELYQAHKRFSDGSYGLSIQEAKGRACINIQDCHDFYTRLWIEYLKENKDLILVLNKYNGYSDIFGQAGHCCQAEVIFKRMQKYKVYKTEQNIPF